MCSWNTQRTAPQHVTVSLLLSCLLREVLYSVCSICKVYKISLVCLFNNACCTAEIDVYIASPSLRTFLFCSLHRDIEKIMKETPLGQDNHYLRCLPNLWIANKMSLLCTLHISCLKELLSPVKKWNRVVSDFGTDLCI